MYPFFLGLFIRATDFQKVASSLHRVGYNFIILIITTFIAYFLAAIAWRFCMGPQGKHLSLGFLFIIRHIGETVSLVNPTSIAGGEAMKVFLLSDRGIEKKTIITSVVFARLIMMLSQVLLFLAAAAFLLFNKDVQFSFKLPTIPVVLYILPVVLLLLIVVSKYTNVKTIYTKIKIVSAIKKWTKNFRKNIIESLKQLPLFFKENTKGLTLAFLFFLFTGF